MADGVSRAEFTARMWGPLLSALAALARAHPDEYKNGVLLSYDNASWHNWDDVVATLVRAPLPLVVRKLPLPAQSPDLHKVIEHLIGDLKRKVNRCLMDKPHIRTKEQIKAEFERVWREDIKADGIRKDIRSLEGTYTVVSTTRADGGTDGDLAPKQYRCAWLPIEVLSYAPSPGDAVRVLQHGAAAATQRGDTHRIAACNRCSTCCCTSILHAAAAPTQRPGLHAQ